MLKDFVLLAAVTAAIALGIVLFVDSIYDAPVVTQSTPAVAQPEQFIPQVVFVYSCGVPQGLIITTDPLTFRDVSDPLDDEVAALLDAAIKADKAYNFRGYLEGICNEPDESPI